MTSEYSGPGGALTSADAAGVVLARGRTYRLTALAPGEGWGTLEWGRPDRRGRGKRGGVKAHLLGARRP